MTQRDYLITSALLNLPALAVGVYGLYLLWARPFTRTTVVYPSRDSSRDW